jgi:UDP-glucose 4-epimerase
LLGGAVSAVLSRDHELFAPGRIDWRNDAEAELRTAAARFRTQASDRPWVIAWCAGVGFVGATAAQITRETDLLAALIDSFPNGSNGVVFHSSSAGGVYAGSSAVPISESAEERPLSSYGMAKLEQESLLKAWCDRTEGAVVIGRISNLYGPAQSLSKSQGLVSATVRATLLRKPLQIFVPLDTIRDYLYVDDCAQMVRHLIRLATPRTAVVKILASGRPLSVGGLLAEVRRVSRTNPLVVMSADPQPSAHGSRLVFRSTVLPEVDRRSFTSLPAGIGAVIAATRAQLGAGVLRW